MAGKKKAPIKLTWFEEVTAWLAGLDEDGNWTRPPELPEGVSRSAMNQTVAMVMRATTSHTNEAFVSVRWIEKMTGVHHHRAAKALEFLEGYGWISWTQRTQNKAKWYEIHVPQVGTIYPHRESSQILPGGDSGGDSGEDALSPTPGTPVTPQEESIKRGAGLVCSNCSEPHDAHDPDCAFRPFGDPEPEIETRAPGEEKSETARAVSNLADAGFDFEKIA